VIAELRHNPSAEFRLGNPPYTLPPKIEAPETEPAEKEDEGELDKADALSSSSERTAIFDSFLISMVRAREDMYGSRGDSVGEFGEEVEGRKTLVNSLFF
jgi:hypothetical protein